MTTTNNTNTLKPRQLQFIQWMDEHYPATVDADTTFSRGELRTLAVSNGVKWAPAWIVKDTSRQRGRGEYVVPELAEYRGNATTPANDDADKIVGIPAEDLETIRGDHPAFAAPVTTDEEAEARAEEILSPEEFNKAMDEHEAMEREYNMI